MTLSSMMDLCLPPSLFLSLKSIKNIDCLKAVGLFELVWGCRGVRECRVHPDVSHVGTLDHKGMGVARVEAEGGECSERKVSRGERLTGVMGLRGCVRQAEQLTSPCQDANQARGGCHLGQEQLVKMTWQVPAHSQDQVTYKKWEVGIGGVKPLP